jgi:hypothetical protein
VDWAQSLEFGDGGMVAVTAGLSHEKSEIPVEQLCDQGLPKATEHRFRRHVDLSAFNLVDSTEYLTAFGLPADAGQRHKVFEAQTSIGTLVIPALAWIRAFFVPNAQVLREVFRPHFLERHWYLDVDSGVARQASGIALGRPSSRAAYGNYAEIYTWMISHPSALRMAGSVHQAAMRGELGIELPAGSARLTLTGKFDKARKWRRAARRFYVTSVTITEVTPGDTSIFSEEATKRVVAYRTSGRQSRPCEPGIPNLQEEPSGNSLLNEDPGFEQLDDLGKGYALPAVQQHSPKLEPAASGMDLKCADPAILRLGEALASARRQVGPVLDSEWRYVGQALRMRDIRGVDKRATFNRLLPLLPEALASGSRGLTDWNQKELAAVGGWEKTGELKAALETLAVFRLDPEVVEALGLV